MNDPAARDPESYSPLSPFATGLRGRCPRCGRASIFDGFLELKPSCAACGFDLSNADTGDGPSFFASFIGGFVVLAIGVYMQIVYDPPFWTYLVLLLLGSLLIVGMLRPIKGLLTSLQYTNKAAEGRLER